MFQQRPQAASTSPDTESKTLALPPAKPGPQPNEQITLGEKVAGLLMELNSESYQKREKATEELKSTAGSAEILLELFNKNPARITLEQKARIGLVLRDKAEHAVERFTSESRTLFMQATNLSDFEKSDSEQSAFYGAIYRPFVGALLEQTISDSARKRNLAALLESLKTAEVQLETNQKLSQYHKRLVELEANPRFLPKVEKIYPANPFVPLVVKNLTFTPNIEAQVLSSLREMISRPELQLSETDKKFFEAFLTLRKYFHEPETESFEKFADYPRLEEEVNALATLLLAEVQNEENFPLNEQLQDLIGHCREDFFEAESKADSPALLEIGNRAHSLSQVLSLSAHCEIISLSVKDSEILTTFFADWLKEIENKTSQERLNGFGEIAENFKSLKSPELDANKRSKETLRLLRGNPLNPPSPSASRILDEYMLDD